MFAGLSAFPLTPLDETGAIDEPAFERLVARLADAGVDSIGALGSTGSYAYLDRDGARPGRQPRGRRGGRRAGHDRHRRRPHRARHRARPRRPGRPARPR